jgi:flagellar biosynthesis regulator FlaF
MLTEQQRIILQQAIDLLNEADALIQDTLGATDACYDTHCAIEDIISDLEADYLEGQDA